MRTKISILLICLQMMLLLTACGKNGNNDNGNSNTEETVGKVYYMNFKPEVDKIWQQVAKDYTTETGISVKVVTAASGTYESTLMAEMDKKSAPTLFQVNGPVGYSNWKDYCQNLSTTNIYKWLLDKDLAIKGDDGGIYGIPYVVEGYGIIYNEEILDRYFALEDAVFSDMDDIKNFDTLKTLVEDMQLKKEQLGIEGVFASTSLLPGEDWRWQTHLANIPVYYELKDLQVNDSDQLEFTYSDNFKNIFDLYIENSCTVPALLGSKTVDDSMAEFALGKAAMIQNGNWAWSQISGVSGNIVKEDDIKLMPIYTGITGEETQGLCTGTENYFCINKNASMADQEATVDFLEWLFSSEHGKDVITNEFGFIAPFSTFNEDEQPSDPLAQEVIDYMEEDDLNSISWNFTTFPSQTFKDNFGAALLEYASGTKTWDEVVDIFRIEWKVEKENNAQ